MHIRIPALLVAVLLFANGTVARAAHSSSTLLRDVRVIDGNGVQPLEHADVLITGSKIVAVEAQPIDAKKLPPNTTIVK